MKEWKDVLKVSAGKLTTGLAFAVIMLIAVAQFGGQLPPQYQSLPYWLIGLGYGVYAMREIARANVGENGIGRTTPVCTYPLGRSPRGVWDLGGNIWEWQANFYDSDYDWLALRGGSWFDSLRIARLAARDYHSPGYSRNHLGFRVVGVVFAPSSF